MDGIFDPLHTEELELIREYNQFYGIERNQIYRSDQYSYEDKVAILYGAEQLSDNQDSQLDPRPRLRYVNLVFQEFMNLGIWGNLN